MDTTLTHVTSPWSHREREHGRDPGEIPNYELLSFIKSGGFGDVWLARERVTGVRRAVKVVFKSDGERAVRDIKGVKHYQRCAHNHPHLLQILTVGETERCFFYVMEAADNGAPDSSVASDLRVRRSSNDRHDAPDSEVRRYGTGESPDSEVRRYEPVTLRSRMAAAGRFNGRAALELVRKLVAGVARLHQQGLAHYDLKPENILIVEGEPKIADVGLVARVGEQPPAGNLLAGRWHPYSSTAWMSIGHWAWWEGATPSDRPKTIRCTPFSTDRRSMHRQSWMYGGAQMLRFDGARYGDFEAKLRIKLKTPPDMGTYDPFLCQSEAGNVGLAFRMQDQAAQGWAWGPCYCATVTINPNSDEPPAAGIARYAGFGVGRDEHGFALAGGLTGGRNASAAAVCSRDALLCEEGFVLRLWVKGGSVRLYLNDDPRPIVEYEEDPAEALPAGRIALYAMKLIARFESFEVTPLPPE